MYIFKQINRKDFNFAHLRNDKLKIPSLFAIIYLLQKKIFKVFARKITFTFLRRSNSHVSLKSAERTTSTSLDTPFFCQRITTEFPLFFHISQNVRKETTKKKKILRKIVVFFFWFWLQRFRFRFGRLSPYHSMARDS